MQQWRELVAKEHFFSYLPPKLSDWVVERQPGTVLQAARIADKIVSQRQHQGASIRSQLKGQPKSLQQQTARKGGGGEQQMSWSANKATAFARQQKPADFHKFPGNAAASTHPDLPCYGCGQAGHTRKFCEQNTNGNAVQTPTLKTVSKPLGKTGCWLCPGVSPKDSHEEGEPENRALNRLLLALAFH